MEVALQPHEEFLVVIGSAIGFGAPFFAKPFMKRTSTSGKIGGIRGRLAQCTTCNSLWPSDNAGSDALARAGFSREGLVAIEYMAQYRDRQAGVRRSERSSSQEHSESSSDQISPEPPSRVRKSIEPE